MQIEQEPISVTRGSKPALVVFATRHGQARIVANRAAATLRRGGRRAEVADAALLPPDFDVGRYGAAFLVGSVHVGRHEAELVWFTKSHRSALAQMPSAFLSLSMAEASAENPGGSPENRAGAREQAESQVTKFVKNTGFSPTRTFPVAGALLYTQYGRIVRFVMQMIAKGTGAPTDTSRDHVFTDFDALDSFVREFAATLESPRTLVEAHGRLANGARPRRS